MIEVKSVSAKKIEYPYVGICGTLTVLFYKPRHGTVIREGKGREVGSYSDTWIEDSFERYTGEITLKCS